MFANMLLDNNQQSYAQSDVIPAIQRDLDWVFSNWQSQGCDLWE